MAGAPPSPDEDIHAAWLALATTGEAPVAAGATAARLHHIGDLRLDKIDFTTTHRRNPTSASVHHLNPHDLTTADGIPTMTTARTIADLIADNTDPSLVADHA